MDRSERERSTAGRDERAPARAKLPYQPPRVLTDEAFEQISLACMSKFGTKKNFT